MPNEIIINFNHQHIINLGLDIFIANKITMKYSFIHYTVGSRNRVIFDNFGINFNKVIDLLKNCRAHTLQIDINGFFCNLTTQQISKFFQELENSSISKVIFSNPQIQNLTTEQLQNIFPIFQTLKTATNLRTFSIIFCNLSDDDATKLQTVFPSLTKEHNNYIVSLGNDSNIKLYNSSNADIALMNINQLICFLLRLQTMSNLESLDLSGNNLGRMKDYELQFILINLAHLPNLESLNLSGNNFGSMKNQEWQVFLENLAQIPNLKSLDLSGNNLGRMKDCEWQFFCDELKKLNNIRSLNLSGNNLEFAALDGRLRYLINILKDSNVNNIDFGEHIIKIFSDQSKKDLADLHLTKIPLSRYQKMSILQFAAKVYGLNCKIAGVPEEKENRAVRSSWLVAKLISQNILCDNLIVDITMFSFLEYYASSEAIFQKPISECQESVDLINKIYNDNPQLQTIRVAHQELFMSASAEFLKAHDVGAYDIKTRHMDKITEQRRAVTQIDR
jgi:hypothetical protein